MMTNPYSLECELFLKPLNINLVPRTERSVGTKHDDML